METIIEFAGVSKHYGGIHALNDVSFSIRRGEVHAIVGENGAGKSTLMNVLSGLAIPDAGQVRLRGEEAHIDSPKAAQELGISTVYQELKLCGNLNVVQNLFLGRMETRFGLFPRWDSMRSKARKLVHELGVDVDVDGSLKGLSVAKMQIVEIAKALSLACDILILDEPTSSLTILETRKLVKIIADLRTRGMTILFISHRLEEVFEIADRVTVMRNGRYLKTMNIAEANMRDVVSLIAGREIAIGRNRRSGPPPEGREVVLETVGLSREGCFRDISFKLHRGELLGFYGLQGAGRTELMETIFGLAQADSGGIFLRGKPFHPKTAKDAIRDSIGMVMEDRKNLGLFMNFNIWQNIAIIHDRKISRLGILVPSAIRRMAEGYIRRFSIKCRDATQMVRNLSGGNQQKVVLSKVMSTDPEIVLLDEPTRGIDVGAKSEIFRILEEVRRESGASVIMVTSEIKEVVEECGRVLVMRNGRIAGELRDDAVTEEAVLDLAFNG